MDRSSGIRCEKHPPVIAPVLSEIMCLRARCSSVISTSSAQRSTPSTGESNIWLRRQPARDGPRIRTELARLGKLGEDLPLPFVLRNQHRGSCRNCAPDCALTGVYPRQTPSLTGEYRQIFCGGKLLKRRRKECFHVSTDRSNAPLSKRAPSTTRTSLRVFRISSLRASG
jgi:hypothetical protein